MSPTALNELGTIVAILLGSGAIGGGTARAARAQIRKARASEELTKKTSELLAELVDGHRSQAAHHALLEYRQWKEQTQQTAPPLTSSTPWPPNHSADMRARLPASPSPSPTGSGAGSAPEWWPQS